jgi:NAD+ synthase (glutamine-hydrolysing)
MNDGFIKVAAATTDLKVADCAYNSSQIIAYAKEGAAHGAKLMVFPELCITAYTCGDLFLQRSLLEKAQEALLSILQCTRDLSALLLVGLPVSYNGGLYNCAAVLYRGSLLGLVPKRNIPSYSEFYETRHFSPGPACEEILFCGKTVPFGTNLLFACRDLPEFTLGVELCEDVWVTVPPSCAHALAGATVIANLSASDEIIGKADYRRDLITSQSAKTISAYVYADAGRGESSTDMVFAGHDIIAENGSILAQSRLFQSGVTYGDIDVLRLDHERRRTSTFVPNPTGYRKIFFDMPLEETRLSRRFPQTPFVPRNKTDLAARCEAILALQANGLATRLRHTNAKTAVVGLSGGLDSTLALLVTAHAFDILGRNRKDIVAVTMPCFGTTARTKNNAVTLAEAYGTKLLEINIRDAVLTHFRDIGQKEDCFDVTFENSQARERTQVLMDIANQTGGLVIGTGDLSELALGWATYNGDHMSMYGVNASVPKTLVRYLVAYEAQSRPALLSVLADVLDTPVSPELLPPKDGEIAQKTEELVGPYELHDFFLYYFVRFGYSPKKIFRIASAAFAGVYDNQTIKKWLVTFVRRFFQQQFKRSCLPDGPKVGSVTLSPRGDFRMPSDACGALWLAEAEAL